MNDLPRVALDSAEAWIEPAISNALTTASPNHTSVRINRMRKINGKSLRSEQRRFIMLVTSEKILRSRFKLRYGYLYGRTLY